MEEVKVLARKCRLILCPAMAAVGVIGTLLYPHFTGFLTQNEAFAAGWLFFAILMGGIAVASSYIPFSNTLNQWGYPGWFMLCVTLQVATNLVLNTLLISHFGSLGAAIATAVAFIMTIAYLKIFVKHVAKVTI